ncbi:hypothetical protein, partial [Rhizobium sp. PP-F2F-G48]|uniref:hypothetical protein n=1 Tax=Rhizobium sp. PP-F2F-G48 TaxID=2135651 RepID=UPI001A9FA3EA
MTNREDESKMEVTDAMVNSACMSYRHDFGLLPELDREALRRTARWWLEAWQKEGFVLSNPSQGERVETPSPQNNGTLTDETIDRVAAAIEGAQISHSLKLTRLVDGISTYTVTVD